MNESITMPEQRMSSDLPPIVFDDLAPAIPGGGRRLGMKIHKPSQKEFDDTYTMLQLIDEYLENGSVDDGDDRQDENGDWQEPPQLTDEEFIELLRTSYDLGGFRWQAVLWAGDTAIRNTCDPDADVLEFRPDIQRLLESAATADEIMPGHPPERGD